MVVLIAIIGIVSACLWALLLLIGNEFCVNHFGTKGNWFIPIYIIITFGFVYLITK